MMPRILAARLDVAEKRITAAVERLAAGRDVPALPFHRDPQQQALFRQEWIADRLDELVQAQAGPANEKAQPQPDEKPKRKAGKDD